LANKVATGLSRILTPQNAGPDVKNVAVKQMQMARQRSIGRFGFSRPTKTVPGAGLSHTIYAITPAAETVPSNARQTQFGFALSPRAWK